MDYLFVQRKNKFMSPETKRLAIIATICFFPAALVGWWFYPKSEKLALSLFRCSINLILVVIFLAGIIVVIKGAQIIKPMGSFF